MLTCLVCFFGLGGPAHASGPFPLTSQDWLRPESPVVWDTFSLFHSGQCSPFYLSANNSHPFHRNRLLSGSLISLMSSQTLAIGFHRDIQSANFVNRATNTAAAQTEAYTESPSRMKNKGEIMQCCSSN